MPQSSDDKDRAQQVIAQRYAPDTERRPALPPKDRHWNRRFSVIFSGILCLFAAAVTLVQGKTDRFELGNGRVLELWAMEMSLPLFIDSQRFRACATGSLRSESARHCPGSVRVLLPT